VSPRSKSSNEQAWDQPGRISDSFPTRATRRSRSWGRTIVLAARIWRSWSDHREKCVGASTRSCLSFLAFLAGSRYCGACGFLFSGAWQSGDIGSSPDIAITFSAKLHPSALKADPTKSLTFGPPLPSGGICLQWGIYGQLSPLDNATTLQEEL
jgi:hypothetical protein